MYKFDMEKFKKDFEFLKNNIIELLPEDACNISDVSIRFTNLSKERALEVTYFDCDNECLCASYFSMDEIAQAINNKEKRA